MKIMERGQITIPKKYRERYGIRPGTEIDIVPQKEGLLIMKKMNTGSFRKVYGILEKENDTDSIIEEMRGK